jgi:hypothetical protein
MKRNVAVTLSSLCVLLCLMSCATTDTVQLSGTQATRLSDIEMLLAQTAEQRKTELLKSFAQSLRDEAYNLQLRGFYEKAIMKYKESLAYFPDAELEKYLKAIQAKTRPSSAPPAGQKIACYGETAVVTAIARNRSAGTVHILTVHDTMKPENLFLPGQIKKIDISLDPNCTVTFIAVRDGKTLDSITWQGDAQSPDMIPSIVFDDTVSRPVLVVMTGMK